MLQCVSSNVPIFIMKSSDKQLEESSWSCSHNNQFETPKELHDITEQFLEVFQNSEFPTFESLKVALGEFSRVSLL